MSNQVPSIGRVVHYVEGEKHFAALITDPDYEFPDGYGGIFLTAQALVVFPPMEVPFTRIATEDATGKVGTWHWPEYVPAVVKGENATVEVIRSTRDTAQ